MFLRHVPLLMVAGLLSACQTGPYVSTGLPYGAAADVANTPVPVYGAATCVPGCTGGVPVGARPGNGDALQSALVVGGGAAPAGMVPDAGAGMVYPSDNMPSVDDYTNRPASRTVRHRVVRPLVTDTSTVPDSQQVTTTSSSGNNAPFKAQPKSKDPAVNAALAPAPVTAVYGKTASTNGAGPTVPDPLSPASVHVKKTDPSRLVGVPLPDGSVPSKPGTSSALGATPGCKQMPDGSCRTIVPPPAN